MIAAVIVDGVLTTAPIRGIIQLSPWCRSCDLAVVGVVLPGVNGEQDLGQQESVNPANLRSHIRR